MALHLLLRLCAGARNDPIAHFSGVAELAYSSRVTSVRRLGIQGRRSAVATIKGECHVEWTTDCSALPQFALGCDGPMSSHTPVATTGATPTLWFPSPNRDRPI